MLLVVRWFFLVVNYSLLVIPLLINFPLPGGQWEQRVSKVSLITWVLLIYCGITVFRKNWTPRWEVESLEYKDKCIFLNYQFGVYVLQILLKHINNFSKALQNSEMSACKSQTLAALSIEKLEKMIPLTLFGTLQNITQHHWIYQSHHIIPRKRKYLGEQETPQDNDITKAKLMYRRVYLNVIETIIACVKERFDQPGFEACQSL